MSDTDPRTWVACRLCKGTGWVLAYCTKQPPPDRYADLPRRHCGRSKAHAGHPFSERCDCRRVP